MLVLLFETVLKFAKCVGFLAASIVVALFISSVCVQWSILWEGVSRREWDPGPRDVFLWISTYAGSLSLSWTIQAHHRRPDHQRNPGPGVLPTSQGIMGGWVQVKCKSHRRQNTYSKQPHDKKVLVLCLSSKMERSV